MKKNIFLLAFAVVITAFFVACDDDDNDEPHVYPKASFSYSYKDSALQQYVEFSNSSENATSYRWDFGDSTYSTEENPTHSYSEDGNYIVHLTAYNESDSDMVADTVIVDYWTEVDKPNIYLYPESNIDINVSLAFPQGGKIIKSIPDYNNEWNVSVDTSGIIDNKYEYLFYESLQPDVWQYGKGWCVKKDGLKEFFETNMAGYNFSAKEINDFVSYWIPRLTKYEYYCIYPQLNEQIDKVIKIDFSIQPDNVFRLFYGITGSGEYKSITGPEINKINRTGFYTVEWGVFIK